jgi:hypothetical protein
LKVNRRLERKVLLRRLARGLIPDQVIEKKKIGFSTAVEGWFRSQLAVRRQIGSLPARDELPTRMRSARCEPYRRGEDVNTRPPACAADAQGRLADTLPRAMSSRAHARHEHAIRARDPGTRRGDRPAAPAESLAAQTVKPDVWIIVDNGSTDK